MQIHIGESHEKAEAGIGGTCLQAKECRGLPATPRGWRRQGRVLSGVSGRTLMPDFWPSELF